ncbi:MAG: hypothetical protein ACLP50_07990 [Solirubrobacteraceae bacterium]
MPSRAGHQRGAHPPPGRRATRRALTALGLAAALALGACGSSALSASQLRSSATAICELARQRTNRIPDPSAPTGGEEFLARGIAALEPELAALRRLAPPADLAAELKEALTASADELRALKTTVAGLARGGDPVVAVGSLQHRLSPVETHGNAVWQALGIPACAAR